MRGPRWPILAAIEKINPKDMPATVDAALIAKMGEAGKSATPTSPAPMPWTSPSRQAAQCKRVKGPVAGRADILLCPDLNSANILYKALIHFAGREVANAMIGVRRRPW